MTENVSLGTLFQTEIEKLEMEAVNIQNDLLLISCANDNL